VEKNPHYSMLALQTVIKLSILQALLWSVRSKHAAVLQ